VRGSEVKRFNCSSPERLYFCAKPIKKQQLKYRVRSPSARDNEAWCGRIFPRKKKSAPQQRVCWFAFHGCAIYTTLRELQLAYNSMELIVSQKSWGKRRWREIRYITASRSRTRQTARRLWLANTQCDDCGVVKHTKLPLCRWNNKKDTPLARPSSFLKLIIALTVVREEFHRVLQQHGPTNWQNWARTFFVSCSKKVAGVVGKLSCSKNAKNYEGALKLLFYVIFLQRKLVWPSFLLFEIQR